MSVRWWKYWVYCTLVYFGVDGLCAADGWWRWMDGHGHGLGLVLVVGEGGGGGDWLMADCWAQASVNKG